MTITLLRNIARIIIISNTILAFYIVFHRKRSVLTTWAWLIILLIFPIIGMIIYGFFGRGLSQENIFAINKQYHIGLYKVQESITRAPKKTSPADTTNKAKMLIQFFNRNGEAPVSKNNQVQLYTDGNLMFADMLQDIAYAKETVNIEFYTFYDDKIGNQILNLLIQKAQEGVQVRVLYDAWGSLGASSAWFDQLRNVGGQVLPFITSRDMITRYRINYHLHRKIVVVDGKTAWTGGFNIGDQYLGHKKKFGYWRDSHVRIIGSASLLLQERFVMDWNASIRKDEEIITFSPLFFPDFDETDIHPGDVAAQIVSDGPDSDEPSMRNGVMKLMSVAQKRLWIQSPYLIPDDAMFATLQTIAMSGVDVRIMIPCKPDHPIIYRATQWYANELSKYGVKIYIYNNGFLHAKTILVDNDFATVGSMNQDYRSYDLNFEDIVVFYNQNFNQQLADAFEHDMTQSTLLTKEIIANQSKWLKTLQSFSWMFSPIL